MPNCWRNRRAVCEHGQRHRPDPGLHRFVDGAVPVVPRPGWPFPAMPVIAQVRGQPASRARASTALTSPPSIEPSPVSRSPPAWSRDRASSASSSRSSISSRSGTRSGYRPSGASPARKRASPVVTGCPPATLRPAQRYRPQHGGPGFSSAAVSPGSDLLDSFVEDPPSALVFMGEDGACCSQVGGVVDQLGRRIQVAGRGAGRRGPCAARPGRSRSVSSPRWPGEGTAR